MIGFHIHKFGYPLWGRGGKRARCHICGKRTRRPIWPFWVER